MENKLYVIVGASRGLGASLVSKYLEKEVNVIGIGRTVKDEIESIAAWEKTNYFRYVQADIGKPKCIDIMKSILSLCDGNSVCVIFNAAVIESDVRRDGKLMFDVFKRITHTGVDGFGHILEVFGDYLPLHGGMLVGISSMSAWVPPIRGNKVAYPASKAYLDMALRSLRLLWYGRVHVMTVYLGHIGDHSIRRSALIPTYDAVAEKIVQATLCSRPPKSICVPRLYGIAYRIIKIMPDRLVSKTVEFAKGLLERIFPEETLP